MDENDRTMLSSRVPNDLKALVDADPRANQEVVETALLREFGGERQGAIERRIEEKERRLSTIESEKNEREREMAELENKLEALREKKEGMVSQEQKVVNEAVETLSIHPDEGHSHAAAEHWADKAGMDKREFWDRYSTQWHKVNDA